MPAPSPEDVPLPRDPLGFTPLLERSIRFVVGIGLLVREVVIYEAPRVWVLVLTATLSGTSLTAIADDLRREASKFGRKDGDQ